MADIDRLIRALSEAQADPTEEAVTRCLGMARAVKAAHEQALVVAGDAAADEVWRERVDAHQSALQNLLLARADAERVRRGARCLRERCRRLEARARAVEEAHRAFLDAAYERGRRFREALTRAKRCIDERVCVMGMSKEEA